MNTTTTRYMISASNNGHIHAHRCAALRFDTRITFFDTDLDREGMVAKFGEKCCTNCFPTAPVAPRVASVATNRVYCEGVWAVDQIGWQFKRGVCGVCRQKVVKNSDGRLRKHVAA